ncbi:hypothetical protein AMATHDRAFT_75678 [Amanita thiersii Skay4041]|uniref:TrmE-type G domain-containing protein n=1 Tax=Amanita thiersii Skay4041 TaxID=703135 RepID=A0A2A9NLZ4_9AGAR|nr:hypothetical protein AMATHDRAFT_75678 [Amanita thiersii Skay4041]
MSFIRSSSIATSRTFFSTLTRSDAQQSTIYALSTPPGKAGVAVVRVSGKEAISVWKQMVRPTYSHSAHLLPRSWRMEHCRIVKPSLQCQPTVSESVLDEGLAVYFKGPRSFTTEDVVELHVHSGRAVVASILSALSTIPFCRPAEPGEFTRRAFLGGRLDLTQVEGLKDLIDAETESQRKMAVHAAGGAMRATYEELRNGIIRCLASVEALIDFGEGEDIEDGVYEQATTQARGLLDTIRTYLSDGRRGELIRSGVRLAIFGPPNVGKSSLLNFLAQREAAIVTPIPGTTRDLLELSLDIGGLPIIVTDTAGLRKTHDVVEQIGVKRATNAVQEADAKLCVLSISHLPNDKFKQQLRPLKSLINSDTFFLFNKADLLPSERTLENITNITNTIFDNLLPQSSQRPHAWVASLKTGEGTREFIAGFGQVLQEKFDVFDTDVSAHAPLITRERHRVHLEAASQYLEAFLALPPEDVVFAAEELRYAARAVGKVSGAIDVEEVLDSVFSSFCIGK